MSSAVFFCRVAHSQTTKTRQPIFNRVSMLASFRALLPNSFCIQKVGSSAGHLEILAARMGVPEATMYENSNVETRQD